MNQRIETTSTPYPGREQDVTVLLRNGWTPPAELVEPYRHLLRPFYDAKGWKSQPSEKLDKSDVETIAALIATFDHFGIAIPEAPRAAEPGDASVSVLRAFLAEHDKFTTEEAVEAVGWDGSDSSVRQMQLTLQHLGMHSSTERHLHGHRNVTRWTKREPA